MGKIFQVILLLGFAGAGLAGCQGKSAGLAAQPVLIGGLQRQADCSLTYLNFSVASGSNAVTVTPNSQIPHYEKILHDNAQLGTTPDQFPAGCPDPDRGITSRPFLFLGTGKNGRELVAMQGASGVLTGGLKTDGTFTQPATQVTPIPSISLVSGDLNKDGNADVISINSNGQQSSATVFLGKDDGSYSPGVTYALPGANAQYGVLDDLNGDGILDLLVSSDSPNFAFSIFMGNGDGTFQPPQSFVPANVSVGYNQAFITADVNGDGAKDIVTAQGLVFLGTGDGVSYVLMPQTAFSSNDTATNGFAPSIVAADFNHDGKMDLATDDGLTIRTYLGNGDGTFWAGPEYPTIANYGFLAATDLDGDGNIDLWTGYGARGVYGGDAYLPNLAYALMGNGDGTFQGVPGLPVTFTPAATSTAVTSLMKSAKAGTAVTFTAAVVSAKAGTIAGTVTFFDGASQIGSPISIRGGTAVISTSTLKPGVHSITAKYSGDSNFAASVSPPAAQPMTNATSSLVIGNPTPGSLQVVAGQTSTPFTVSVNSPNATTQTVTFSCSNLPVMTTCAFQPSPIMLTATQTSATENITIVTKANTVATPSRRFLQPSGSKEIVWSLALILLTSYIVLFRLRPGRVGWVASACLSLVALACLAGCTNGSTSSTTTFNGTPPGTYAVTISASGNGVTVTTMNTLTLTVTAH